MKINNLTHIGLAILRVFPSVFMLYHGIPKFKDLINGNIEFADPLGIGQAPTLFLAVIAEVVCPILIIVGYKTKWATIPLALTMLVAAFMVHGADPFNIKEKALLYLVVFVTIYLLGPGKYSIDKK